MAVVRKASKVKCRTFPKENIAINIIKLNKILKKKKKFVKFTKRRRRHSLPNAKINL